MTTKKAFLKLSFIVLLSLVLYLIFSFGAWELNPAKWNSEIRVLFSILSMIMVGSVFSRLYDY